MRKYTYPAKVNSEAHAKCLARRHRWDAEIPFGRVGKATCKRCGCVVTEDGKSRSLLDVQQDVGPPKDEQERVLFQTEAIQACRDALSVAKTNGDQIDALNELYGQGFEAGRKDMAWDIRNGVREP